MYDVSERFLFQLVADRKESLLRSGRAAAQRPFRRALRQLSRASGLHQAASRRRIARPTAAALAATEGETCLLGKARLLGGTSASRPATRFVTLVLGTSTATLRQEAQHEEATAF